MFFSLVSSTDIHEDDSHRPFWYHLPFSLHLQYNVFISYIDENRRATLLDVGELGKHKVFKK